MPEKRYLVRISLPSFTPSTSYIACCLRVAYRHSFSSSAPARLLCCATPPLGPRAAAIASPICKKQSAAWVVLSVPRSSYVRARGERVYGCHRGMHVDGLACSTQNKAKTGQRESPRKAERGESMSREQPKHVTFLFTFSPLPSCASGVVSA